ncbi:MAG: nitrilase-related carbon-nitrogen hydrolase [Gemmobacter sp.]
MRLAVLQSPSPAGDADAGLATLAPALRAAGAAGADVLVAPETFLPGYNCDAIPALAQPRGGPWHLSLATLARDAGCAVITGYAERDGDRVHNAAVAFDATGSEIAHFRKVQLYGPREMALYLPGDAYCTFELNGIRAAILICYDIEFAPHVAALAVQGISVILVPTANMAPFTHVVRHTVPAMAANHGLAIAYANYCGTEGDLAYVGGSLIAGPHGEVLAQAGDHPALLIADVPHPDPLRRSTQAQDLRRL